MPDETATLEHHTRLPLDRLRAALRGPVLGPGMDGYDAARRVWNAAIDRHPAVIARCTGSADVLAAVRFARNHNLPIAVRGGGHNVAGNAVCDDGIVIDLSLMKGVVVDPQRRTALAQPGVTWGELDHETCAFGLATPGGIVSTTGIAGFTLGGGLGWLSRKHGTASDNLVSADLVTADGQVVTADEAAHTDLFWALRGGGGNFGIVTAFRYRLHPVPTVVLGGVVFYPEQAAPDVLAFVREVLAPGPDDLAGAAALRIAPPAPFLPAEARGTPVIALAVCWFGNLEEGRLHVGALRGLGRPLADLVRPQPYTEIQRLSDTAWGPGFHNFWKAEYLQALPDAAIGVLVQHAREITSPLSDVKVIPGGGAVARAPSGHSSFAHRTAPFIVNINTRWSDPAESARHVAWTRALWEALGPFSTGGVYVNFLGDEGDDRVRAAYGPTVYERLADVKRRYDPDNVFRFNQNVRPREP